MQSSDRIDSFWFANHDSPSNQNQFESKIEGRWIVIHSIANHWLIRFRIKSKSKWIANQAGPSPEPMVFTEFQQFIRGKITVQRKFNLSWIIYRYTKLAVFGFFLFRLCESSRDFETGPEAGFSNLRKIAPSAQCPRCDLGLESSPSSKWWNNKR